MFYFIRQFLILFTIAITHSQPIEDYDRIIDIFSSESSKSFTEQDYQDLRSVIEEVNQNWINRLTYLKEKDSIWRSKPSLSPEDHVYVGLGLESCEKLESYWGNFVKNFQRFRKVHDAFKQANNIVQDCVNKETLPQWGIIKEEIPFYLALNGAISTKMNDHIKTLASSLLRKIKELQSQTTHLVYPTTGYIWTLWNSSARKASRIWNDGIVFDPSPDFLTQIPIMEQLAKEEITPFYWDFIKCLPNYPSPQRKDIFLDTLSKLITALKLDLEQIKSQLDTAQET